MIMDRSITFESSDVYGGMGICTGLLRFSPREASLHFEWQLKDGFAGILKSDLKTRTVQIDDILSATYKSGLLGGKITLRSHSLTTFDGIPGADGIVLALKLPRRDRKDAKHLVSEIDLLLSERALSTAAGATDLPC